jgi:hypothetical protein
MKSILLYVFLVLGALISFGADTPIELNLLDGSKLKGKITSNNGSEITVMSDLGVFRIPLEKLTTESRQVVTMGAKPDVDALLRRVAELEAKVSQLQQENESLRRQVVTATPTSRPSSGAQSLTPQGSTTQPAAGASHTISSTGKRHNSGCRYFGSGKPCGPTDGIACKVCGG